MILTTSQRITIYEDVLPRLQGLGLAATIDRAVDPEDATEQDCLVVVGSKDGPYRTAKRVGEVLIEFDEAFADLLVVRAAPTRVRIACSVWCDLGEALPKWEPSPVGLRWTAGLLAAPVTAAA